MQLSTSIDGGVMCGVARASVYLCCGTAVPSCALVRSDVVSSEDGPLGQEAQSWRQ